MKLGTHNSMTYLKPKKWYLYPFRFMARCQSKTIQEQYEEYGIRFFDLRIKFDKNGNPEFAHGSISYKEDVDYILRYLNSRNEEVKVRFVLEIKKPNELQENLFKLYCALCESLYSNIKFNNGRRKCDWQVVYDFENPEPEYDEKVSSTTWKIWDDWCPYIYARLMNKKNIKKGTDKEYMTLDFIQIQ